MDSSTQVAQVGDIFVLLVPSAQELQQLRTWQYELRTHLGGEIADHVHITCQRFSTHKNQDIEECITALMTNSALHEPFPVLTDKIIHFEAPYYQHHVVRWRVKGTKSWQQFRNLLDTTLQKANCPSHFHRRRHASCTALNMKSGVVVDADIESLNFSLPKFLFTAQQIVVSRLNMDHDFETLSTFSL